MIDLPANVVKWFRTGSSYICNPPVTNTDYDLVLYVNPEHFEQVQVELGANTWERGGSRGEREEWASFKRTVDGVVYNLIITPNEDRYSNMYIATSIAKQLNLLQKNERVMLFSAIVDGEVPLYLEGTPLSDLDF